MSVKKIKDLLDQYALDGEQSPADKLVSGAMPQDGLDYGPEYDKDYLDAHRRLFDPEDLKAMKARQDRQEQEEADAVTLPLEHEYGELKDVAQGEDANLAANAEANDTKNSGRSFPGDSGKSLADDMGYASAPKWFGQPSKYKAPPQSTPEKEVRQSGPDWNKMQRDLELAMMSANMNRVGETGSANIIPGYKADLQAGQWLVDKARLPFETLQKQQDYESKGLNLEAAKANLEKLRRMQDREADLNNPSSKASARVRNNIKTLFKDLYAGNPELEATLNSLSGNEIDELIGKNSLGDMMKNLTAERVAKLKKKAEKDPKSDEAVAYRDSLERSGLYSAQIKKLQDAGVWDNQSMKSLDDLQKAWEVDRQIPGKVQVAVAGAAGKQNVDNAGAQVEGVPVGFQVVDGYIPTIDDKKLLKKNLSNAKRVAETIGELKALLANSNSVSRRTDPVLRTQLKAKQQELKDRLRDTENFGVPSGKDMEQVGNRITDPTDISLNNFMTDYGGQLDALQGAMNKALDASMDGMFQRIGPDRSTSPKSNSSSAKTKKSFSWNEVE